MSTETCQAAQAIHKDVKVINGSFDDIKGLKISYLIAVNFIHNIAPTDLEITLIELSKRNEIQYFILDSVTGDYQFSHDIRTYGQKWDIT